MSKKGHLLHAVIQSESSWGFMSLLAARDDQASAESHIGSITTAISEQINHNGLITSDQCCCIYSNHCPVFHVKVRLKACTFRTLSELLMKSATFVFHLLPPSVADRVWHFKKTFTFKCQNNQIPTKCPNLKGIFFVSLIGNKFLFCFLSLSEMNNEACCKMSRLLFSRFSNEDSDTDRNPDMEMMRGCMWLRVEI